MQWLPQNLSYLNYSIPEIQNSRILKCKLLGFEINSHLSLTFRLIRLRYFKNNSFELVHHYQLFSKISCLSHPVLLFSLLLQL